MPKKKPIKSRKRKVENVRPAANLAPNTWKKTGGNTDALELFRALASGQIYSRSAKIVRGHILKRLRLFSPNVELRNGSNVSISLRRAQLELDQPVRLRISQRLEKYGVDHCKDGRIGADTERQRQHTCRHEAWALPQRAARKTHVLQQILRQVQKFHIVTPLGLAVLAGNPTELFSSSLAYDAGNRRHEQRMARWR